MLIDEDFRKKARAISLEQLRELRRIYPDIGAYEPRPAQSSTFANKVDALNVFTPQSDVDARV